MSQEESAGDGPECCTDDLVDAFPRFGIYSTLDANRPTVEEAMEVQKAKDYEISPTYNMTHTRRGIALIINNEEFNPKTGMSTRGGSSRDVESIRTALTKLEFQVIARNNMTVGQMKRIFGDISADDHTHNDCFLCVILTHGDDGGVIYGTDGNIPLDDLVACVLPNKCKSLSGKPKLFYVQACRGTKLDKGVEVHDALGGFSSSTVVAQKIPLWADMLIAYSSVPGYYSWRNCRNGSWFMQALSSVFERFGQELEIHQLMTKVNYQVAHQFESKSNDSRMNRMKQVPCVASMLTKELFFYPKTPKH